MLKNYTPSFEQTMIRHKRRLHRSGIPRQPNRHMLDVFLFIHGFKQNHDYSPSIREICDGVHISSTSVASYYIDQLRGMGYIDFVPYESRTLHLTERGKEYVIQVAQERKAKISTMKIGGVAVGVA